MKYIKFKARVKLTGNVVKGGFFCEERPNRAQTIVEKLVGERLTNFMFVVKDLK